MAKVVAVDYEPVVDFHDVTEGEAKSKYPMFVMPLDRALALTKLEPHQAYKQRGEIVEYSKGMHVLFVSHEWVARAHPDPDMQQFRVFQKVFGRDGLVAGNPSNVSSHWTDAVSGNNETPITTKAWKALLKDPRKVFVWFDFISVPQKVVRDSNWAEEQSAAIGSIPEYVDNSAMFVVLAPSLNHLVKDATVEYATWRKRGWCRAESAAKLLSLHEKHGPMVVIQSPKQIFFSQRTLALSSSAVGNGNFGCCEMGHQMTLPDGTVRKIACDKLKLGDVLARRIKKLLAVHAQKDTGSIVDYRHLLTIQRHLVRGLPNGARSFKPPVSLSGFLELYHFESVTDNAYFPDGKGCGIGMTPLYYAAMAGNVPVLKALLAMPEVLAKINLQVKKTATSSRYGEVGMKGSTALLAAARFSNSPATLQLLVEHGADPSATFAWDIAPTVYALHWMAIEHSLECIAWWLDQHFDGPTGDIEVDCGNGATPLSVAMTFGGGDASETVKLLVNRGASLKTNLSGVTNLNYAIFGWDIDAFSTIISLGGQASIDTMHVPQKPVNAFLRRFWWLFRMLYYAGDQRWWVFVLATGKGNTTLLAASLYSLAMTKTALRHRPDLHAKLKIGLTPLQVAQKWEHGATVDVLLDALQRENENGR
jgi:ankyrin repeat protein